MTIGQKILELRTDKGLSQEELAEIIGVSRHTVGKWENDIVNPNAENINKICETFGVDANYLMSDSCLSESAATDNRKNKSVFKIVVISILAICAVGLIVLDVFLGMLVLTPSKGSALANSNAFLNNLVRVDVFLNDKVAAIALFTITVIFTVAAVATLVALLIKRKSSKIDLK